MNCLALGKRTKFQRSKSKMASNAPTTCRICNGDYDDDLRCPRLLPCSHCLCAHCIEQLILRNTQKCPFCRQVFYGQVATDFKINTEFLDLVNFIKKKDKRSEPLPKGRRFSKISKMKPDTEKLVSDDIIHCQNAQDDISLAIHRISALNRVIKKTTDKTEREILKQLHKMISSNKKQMEDLEKGNQLLAKQLTTMKEKHERLREIHYKIKSGDFSKKSEDVLRETEDIRGDFQLRLQEVKVLLGKEEKMRNMMIKIFRRRENILSLVGDALKTEVNENEEDTEVHKARQYLDQLRYAAESSTQEDAQEVTQEEIQDDITVESLLAESGQIKSLLEQGRIYACQHEEGRQKYAKVSVINEKYLCVHYLKEEAPPPRVHLLRHDDLMDTVKPSARLAFITLKYLFKDQSLGTIFIRLTPYSKRADNFAYLCTGDKGPTYANSRVLSVCNKGTEEEWVRLGDYENKAGEGGNAVVQGAGSEFGSVLKKPWLAGTVTGRWGCFTGDKIASQFDIYTQDIPNEVTDLAFGQVEEGMNVLKKVVASLPNMEVGIVISDCGVVLKTL